MEVLGKGKFIVELGQKDILSWESPGLGWLKSQGQQGSASTVFWLQLAMCLSTQSDLNSYKNDSRVCIRSILILETALGVLSFIDLLSLIWSGYFLAW